LSSEVAAVSTAGLLLAAEHHYNYSAAAPACCAVQQCLPLLHAITCCRGAPYQLYNYLVTGRVLLSWFPQAQGVALLQPVYTLTDPYLNAFRRLPLQFGGIDLSILPAFFLLSVAQSGIASLSAEVR
jgi:YggT family protein